MAIDRTRYRQLQFEGTEILQSRELNWVQEMAQGLGLVDQGGGTEPQVSNILSSIYRQGALFNATVGISGLHVTISPTTGSKYFLFVKDRWEGFGTTNDDTTDNGGTYSGMHTITLTNVETAIYLNWELRQRTSSDDPGLVDTVTNQPTANAGELILHLSHVDTSGVALAGNQIAKNTSPIKVLSFTNSGTLLTLVPQDNINTQALATTLSSGMVKTTTSNPIVVSTNDSRIGSATVSVSDGLVHNTTVRTPVSPGGTNSDGTPIYNLTSDIGGINAAKIIYVTGTQLVSDAITWIKTQINNIKNDFYTLHRNVALGSSNTHPMPTASQVGATPLSHVGQALGLATSHPAVVNIGTGGFRVNRGVAGGGAASDPGYGIFDSLNVNFASLNHDGDVYSKKASAQLFSGLLPPATLTSGNLGLMSVIAQVLKEHVNQVSHKNPHGLAASDIGALSSSGTAYSISFSATSPQPSSSGYVKLGSNWGGIIIQWASSGNTESASTSQNVTFPTAFPTGCFVVVGQATWTSNGDYQTSALTTYSTTRFGFSFRPNRRTDTSVGSIGYMYIAIGY